MAISPELGRKLVVKSSTEKRNIQYHNAASNDRFNYYLADDI